MNRKSDEMLQDPGAPLSEIAEAVDFSEISPGNRTWFRGTGKSPIDVMVN